MTAPAHTHSFSVDTACECGVMLSVLIRTQQLTIKSLLGICREIYESENGRDDFAPAWMGRLRERIAEAEKPLTTPRAGTQGDDHV